jgi:hypothetical protein
MKNEYSTTAGTSIPGCGGSVGFLSLWQLRKDSIAAITRAGKRYRSRLTGNKWFTLVTNAKFTQLVWAKDFKTRAANSSNDFKRYRRYCYLESAKRFHQREPDRTTQCEYQCGY